MHYHVQIEGKPQPQLETLNTYQDDAVQAVPRAGMETAARAHPVVVKLWVPSLVEAGYGPYTYRVKPCKGQLLAFGEDPATDPGWELMYDGMVLAAGARNG